MVVATTEIGTLFLNKLVIILSYLLVHILNSRLIPSTVVLKPLLLQN